MRKILLVLAIASAAYYFFQSEKNNSNQILVNQTPIIQAQPLKPKTSEVKNSAQNSKPQENFPDFSKTIEKDIKSEPSSEIPPDKNQQTSFKRKSTLQLASEKLQIPITEELQKATAFKTWNKDELNVTGIYRGQISINRQIYVISLNLIFNGGDYTIQPISCISMHDSQKLLFKEFYGEGKLKLLRMPEKQYFIIAVKDQYYLQVFVTHSENRKTLVAHLTTKGQQAPFVFELHSIIGSPRDNCE